jgi:hypothetical protein
MWCSFESWRRLTFHTESTLSWRIRKWVSGAAASAARAFTRALYACRGVRPSQAPVGPGRVVVVAEGIELPLQLCQRLRRGLPLQVALQRLVQALDLAAGLRVVGPRVLGDDPQPLHLQLQEHLAAPVVAKQGCRTPCRPTASTSRWAALLRSGSARSAGAFAAGGPPSPRGARSARSSMPRERGRSLRGRDDGRSSPRRQELVDPAAMHAVGRCQF